MTDTLPTEQGQPESAAQPAAPVPTPTPAAGNTPDSVPQSWDEIFQHPRFKELNERARSAETQLSKAQKAQEKAQAEALAEQGKYRELYETVNTELETTRPYKERYEQMIEQVKANNAKRVQAIPEAMRTLVPAYDDPLQVQAWLDANQEKITAVKPVAPDLNGGASSRGNGAAISDAQIREQAARYGVSPELMAQQYGVTLQKK